MEENTIDRSKLSEDAQAILEKVVGDNGTMIFGNLNFFAQRIGWFPPKGTKPAIAKAARRRTRVALSELVRTKVLFREPKGVYTNRPPRPTPQAQTTQNLTPAFAAGNN